MHRRSTRHRPILRTLTGVAGGAALALALVGCAASAPSSKTLSPVDDFAGVPEGTQAPAATEPGADYAVWMKDGKQIGIVLFGSSTCPQRAAKMTVPEGFLESTVTLAELDSSKPCTADLAAHTTVFDAPEFFQKNSDSDIMVGLPSGKVVLSHSGGGN